ncbi:MAG: hypothetical protein MI922_13380 [Bacteroidales bacterium]|nr:hypothetical protein [Bacteroidales bacterium]
MTSCTGCNTTLGWKKYNFQKQWRIPGYFCKGCMEKIGQDFDDHGKITLPKRKCDSCNQEFFFLTTTWQNKKRHRCCDVCKDLDFTDESTSKAALLPPVPSRVPVMMAIFAAFGIMLMIGGFAYVMLVAPQQDSSILHVIIGSCMSGAGFMLARKMVKVRNMILGKTPQLTTEELR